MSDTPNTHAAPKTFEETLHALQTTVQTLESSETGLEDSLKLYEAGQKLVKEAQGHLSRVENTLEVLQAKATGPVAETEATESDAPSENLAPQGGLF